jgi:hypothetical protein
MKKKSTVTVKEIRCMSEINVNTCKVAVFALGGLFDSQVLTVSKVVIFQHFPVTSEENNKYF